MCLGIREVGLKEDKITKKNKQRCGSTALYLRQIMPAINHKACN